MLPTEVLLIFTALLMALSCGSYTRQKDHALGLSLGTVSFLIVFLVSGTITHAVTVLEVALWGVVLAFGYAMGNNAKVPRAADHATSMFVVFTLVEASAGFNWVDLFLLSALTFWISLKLAEASTPRIARASPQVHLPEKKTFIAESFPNRARKVS